MPVSQGLSLACPATDHKKVQGLICLHRRVALGSHEPGRSRPLLLASHVQSVVIWSVVRSGFPMASVLIHAFGTALHWPSHPPPCPIFLPPLPFLPRSSHTVPSEVGAAALRTSLGLR